MFLVLVVLAGLAINNHGAVNPVKSFDELKHAAEVSFENRTTANHKNYNQ